MTGSIIDRYAGRGTPAGEPQTAGGAGVDAGEETETFGCFGWLRGIRDRCVSIEFRKKDGRVVAIPYAYISRMEYDPAGSIILTCGLETITLRGRNLNGELRPGIRLFQGICRHRVPYVQEADRPASLGAETQTVLVERIDWESSGGG